MSKFPGGIVYILVPTADITQEMINFSTTSAGDLTASKAVLPKRTVASVENMILEVEEENLSTTRVFDSFRWCTTDVVNRDFPDTGSAEG